MPHAPAFQTSTRLALALALAHLATFGCADEDSNAAAGALDAIPTFDGTVDLEFGDVDGDDPYLFTRIGGIAEDARGRLIVADMQSHEIRVFDPEGRFLFRFGGPGEGPGELTYPCCLAFGPDGALWVRESTRYSAFQLEETGAEYVRGQRIAHFSQGMVAPVTFDAEGRLVDIGSTNTPEGGSVMTRFHVGADGVADEVPMADPERQATGSTTVDRTFGEMAVSMFVYQPLGPTVDSRARPRRRLGRGGHLRIRGQPPPRRRHSVPDRGPASRWSRAQPRRAGLGAGLDRPRPAAARSRRAPLHDPRPQTAARCHLLRSVRSAVDRKDRGRRQPVAGGRCL